jgi:hypothetical protein
MVSTYLGIAGQTCILVTNKLTLSFGASGQQMISQADHELARPSDHEVEGPTADESHVRGQRQFAPRVILGPAAASSQLKAHQLHPKD